MKNYKYIYAEESNGLSVVENDEGKLGLINLSNKVELIEPKYQWADFVDSN